MINNENIMYMYCNVLGQTEPEKILDIGLFYRQIGGVSRTILNSDVPKKCFITGIDLENSKNYGVYNTIYDETEGRKGAGTGCRAQWFLWAGNQHHNVQPVPHQYVPARHRI